MSNKKKTFWETSGMTIWNDDFKTDEEYVVETKKIPGKGNFFWIDDFRTDEEYVVETKTYGNYLIDVKLTRDRVFVGIEQIKINKNFYDYKDLINLGKKIRMPYPEIGEE